MTQINREIYLNQYEPSPFSFRAARGLDLTVETVTRRQDGSFYTADLEMTMQLVGRSTGRGDSYAMPATDLANGKARAFVPGDGLKDAVGYNVFVYGTLPNAGLSLIGQGKALLYEGGVGVEPSEVDVITSIPLHIIRGLPVLLDLKLWQDASKQAQFVGATVIANLRTSPGEPVLMNMTVTPFAQPNQVRLSLTAEQTAAMPVVTYWDVIAVSEGTTMPLLQGKVTMS